MDDFSGQVFPLRISTFQFERFLNKALENMYRWRAVKNQTDLSKTGISKWSDYKCFQLAPWLICIFSLCNNKKRCVLSIKMIKVLWSIGFTRDETSGACEGEAALFSGAHPRAVI